MAHSPPASGALMRALAAHPEEIGNLIEALHRRTRDAIALLDLMGRLSREAVRLFDDVRWAGVTAQFDGPPFTATHTDERVLVVDESQYAGDDGPCLRAMRTDSNVRMTIEEILGLWPSLGAVAESVGVRSILAVPLHADGRSVGVLNLYSEDVRPPEPDEDLLTVLTEFADRALADFQNSQPYPSEQEAVRRALVQWEVVDQAVRALVAGNGFTVAYARQVLSDQAEDWDRTVPEQAAYVLSGLNLPT